MIGNIVELNNTTDVTKRNIEIKFEGENALILETIKAAKLPELFTYSFNTDAKADMVIHTDINAAPVEKAYNVYCCEPEEMETVCDKADDIWVQPLTRKIIDYKFRRDMDYLKLDEESFMSNNYFETLINSIPDLVWVKDLKGAHLNVNESFCKAVEKPKDDVIGRGHYYIWDMPKEEYEHGEYICLESEFIVMDRLETVLFDELVKTKYGMRQFKTYKSPIFDREHKIIGTMGIAHDVTNLSNVTSELNILIQSMPFAIMVLDTERNIIDLNKKFEEYFGVEKDRYIGESVDKWEEDVKNSFTSVRMLENQERAEFNGNMVIETSSEPIFDIFGNKTGTIILFHDVTVESRMEEQMRKESETDFLTGLYNRRYLFDYANTHGIDGQINTFYIDLDYFKQINDTKGHAFGDRALRIVSNILTKSFPEGICVRLGGDEFAVVTKGDYSAEELKAKADGLIESLKAECIKHKFDIMTLSIGVAYTTNRKTTISKLLRAADAALYMSKDSGRACSHVVAEEEVL